MNQTLKQVSDMWGVCLACGSSFNSH